MTFADLDLPIPASGSELLDVLDSTKLSRFIDCPRGFFFEYLLGWRRTQPNVHLAFGSAWHEGMEVMMQSLDGKKRGYSTEDYLAAVDAFNRVWDEIYADESNLLVVSGDESILVEGNDAKNKDNAALGLLDYAKTFRDDSFRTLYTEVSGALPISEGLDIYFKLDTIIEDEDGVWSYEHKTTGRKTQAWMDKWQLMLQVGTYAHVLNMWWGDDVAGIMINGAIFRKPLKSGKSNNEFMRIPIKHDRQMMALWLWEVNYIYQLLEWNMKQLTECSTSDPVMRAFPRNAESCSKFGCKHPHLCGRIANPLKVCEEPPLGYHVEFWDPRNRGGDDAGEPIIAIPSEEQVLIIERGGITVKGVPGPGQ